jgi:competence protein ComEA
MYRKKEILIICLIFIITIIYFISNIRDTDKERIVSNSYVEVKVIGEVKKEITLTIPKGYTYGYVINKTQIYFNDYSFYDYDLYQPIYENVTITILSTDINNTFEAVSSMVSISRATFDELITIYGIGEKRANKIIEYRKNKKITSFEELQKVLGVSDEVIRKIKSQAVL